MAGRPDEPARLVLAQRPKLNEISDRKFSMDSAQGIVPLTEDEAARIPALEWREEALLQPTAQAQARMAKRHGAAKRTAPPPTTTRRGVMHMRRAPAYTYAMKVAGARPNAFKVGWAFDFKQRARQFNHAAMPGLGGQEYKPSPLPPLGHRAASLRDGAGATIQPVRSATPDNGEIITGLSEKELDGAWVAAISGRL